MPRGGFTAALREYGANLKTENEWLRQRVATLEAQLKRAGLEPIPDWQAPTKEDQAKEPLNEVAIEPRLERFLLECGLFKYAAALQRQGFCDMNTVLGMQEDHMKGLGITPGHALKFATKIKEQKTAALLENSPNADALISAGNSGAYMPGIYRCVHAPRVAVRAGPSRTANAVETLQLGDIVRVCEVVPPCWAKVDESELWARFSSIWPRKPAILKPLKDDGEELEVKVSINDVVRPPAEAFVLIHGAEVGIDGPLLEQISSLEAAEAVWPFRDALELRCLEFDEVANRRQPAHRIRLREQFVQTAKGFIGTPYAKCYHDPADARCAPGSKLFDAPRFMDSAQLIVNAVEELKKDFGFILDVECRPYHLYQLLDQEIADASFLEPGDFIFYEVYNRRTRSATIKHVEVFVSGPLGTESLGSLPWNSTTRTNNKDGVQLFKSYEMEELEGEKVVGFRFFSIRPWLEAEDVSFAHGQAVRKGVSSH
mmetsp:Transcript_34552/g.107582  ORF Transcript_34552/g.107582 Transcript_34552/m.107582 type:complete len:485 (+) Transcript_34552:76-1530(+)